MFVLELDANMSDSRNVLPLEKNSKSKVKRLKKKGKVQRMKSQLMKEKESRERTRNSLKEKALLYRRFYTFKIIRTVVR